MTERLWIFPTILTLLIALTLSEGFFIVGFVFSVLWFIRILCLKHRTITVLSTLIGVVFIGVVFYHRETNISHLNGNETGFIVYPKVTSIKVNGNSVRFEGVVQKEGIEESVVVQYYLESEAEKKLWLKYPPTTHLAVMGQLAEPSENSNFNQFNYQVYLKRNKTYWQLKADSLTPLEDNQLSKPKFHQIEHIRLRIFQFIVQVFNDKIASYIKTLFFADNRDFSEEVLQQYRSLGVIHLFSISGFHITYLATLIKRVLLRLGVTQERTNLTLVLILPLYGWIAGFGVSVFRSVTQNVLLLVSKAMKRPLDTLDAWSLTALLALFVNPYLVYHISFQLSYTLSGVFILMGKQKWIQELNAINYSLLFSIMSGIASLPILTYHFFEIPWITVFANLFFIPFFTYILFPALLLLFVLSLFFAQTTGFSLLNDGLTLLIEYLESFFALLNSTFDFSLITGRLPALILFFLTINIFSILIKLEKGHYPKIVSIIGLLIGLFYYQISPIGYVMMLDVDQGDSILIKEPGTQKVTLIDTGGRPQWRVQEEWEEQEDPFSIGKDIIVPTLKSFGISTIDRMYLTHADVDHMGEMQAIGQELKIKEVAATHTTLNDPAVLDQLKEMNETKIHLVGPLKMLDYPVKETIAIQLANQNLSKNNQSLVLYVNIGKDKWLFTGDIETEAEQQLIRDYPNLEADYLKVAHHGSQTSSTQVFVEHVQPKDAWISVGKNNTFGHPNEEVLERFKDESVEVYMTSEQGAILARYLYVPVFNEWFNDTQTVHKN